MRSKTNKYFLNTIFSIIGIVFLFGTFKSYFDNDVNKNNISMSDALSAQAIAEEEYKHLQSVSELSVIDSVYHRKGGLNWSIGLTIMLKEDFALFQEQLRLRGWNKKSEEDFIDNSSMKTRYIYYCKNYTLMNLNGYLDGKDGAFNPTTIGMKVSPSFCNSTSRTSK